MSRYERPVEGVLLDAGALCQKSDQAWKHCSDSLRVRTVSCCVILRIDMHALASNLWVHRRSSGVLDPGVLIHVSMYSRRASSSFPVDSAAATRINFALTSQTSSQHKATDLLLPSLELLSPCLRACTAFSVSSRSQNISAKHTLPAYASSGCFVSSKAMVNFGINSASPWMLDVADEDAEVGRCDADAIWASERAVRVKPLQCLTQLLVWLRFLMDTYTFDLAHVSLSCAQALELLPSCHCIAPDPIVPGTARLSQRYLLLTNSWRCALER